MCELAENEATYYETADHQSVVALNVRYRKQWLAYEPIETAILCSILKARFSLLNI